MSNQKKKTQVQQTGSSLFFVVVEVTPLYGNAVSIFLTLTDSELQASS